MSAPDCMEIGIRDLAHRNSELEQDIVERLTDTKGMLVIDEAQHLFLPALETVRSLHDASGVAVVLFVYSGLVGRRQAEFAQISSRIGKKLNLKRAKPADIDALARAWIVNDKHALKELRTIGALPGGLRGVTQTLRMATMIAQGMDQEISATTIRAAWQRIAGDV